VGNSFKQQKLKLECRWCGKKYRPNGTEYCSGMCIDIKQHIERDKIKRSQPFIVEMRRKKALKLREDEKLTPVKSYAQILKAAEKRKRNMFRSYIVPPPGAKPPVKQVKSLE